MGVQIQSFHHEYKTRHSNCNCCFSISTAYAATQITTDCGPGTDCYRTFVKGPWRQIVRDNFRNFPSSAKRACRRWKDANNVVIKQLVSTKYQTSTTRSWPILMKVSHRGCGMVEVSCRITGIQTRGASRWTEFRYRCRTVPYAQSVFYSGETTASP